MKPIGLCFLVLAAAGFVLSLASHVAAFQDKLGPLDEYVWTLHFGALLVCIPAAFAARRLTRGAARNGRWRSALRACPTWMKYGLLITIAYAIVNFAIFFFTPPKAESTGGMSPQAVRGFSGHWMALYWIALTLLYANAKTAPPV